MSLDLNWWSEAGCDMTIWTNVYLPDGAPDRLYKKVFQNPTRMRGDGGLAWRREARKLCIITVRPPPVARWVFGPAWFLHMFHVIRHGKPVVFKPKNKQTKKTQCTQCLVLGTQAKYIILFLFIYLFFPIYLCSTLCIQILTKILCCTHIYTYKLGECRKYKTKMDKRQGKYRKISGEKKGE